MTIAKSCDLRDNHDRCSGDESYPATCLFTRARINACTMMAVSTTVPKYVYKTRRLRLGVALGVARFRR